MERKRVSGRTLQVVYCILITDWLSIPILFQMAIRCTQYTYPQSSYSILEPFWHELDEYRDSRIRVECFRTMTTQRHEPMRGLCCNCSHLT
jgi:hypothetical protein